MGDSRLPSQDDGTPRVVIITGMSGAGRSTASAVLEDLGWFVVDNLPPQLIGRVTELAFAPGSSVTQLGLVADSRGREFFAELIDMITTLRADGLDVRVLFLDADDDELVRRFEETRRRHPAGNQYGVLQGIRHERGQMQELRELADVIIETSQMNVHDLRHRVVGLIDHPLSAELRVSVTSFGFKRGIPRDADMVLDVRFLPNPHWESSLQRLTGRDPAVIEFVLTQPDTPPFLRAAKELLDVVVPGSMREGKRYLSIAIGCTGGKHRSVVLTDVLADHLSETFTLPVDVTHRDLGAE
ncbi:MAG: RNase adapter RapZ [Nitriliruptoraceae bacterium]